MRIFNKKEAKSIMSPRFRSALVVAVVLSSTLAVSPASAQAEHRCNGKPATIVGTPGNDTIRGTDKADVIVGLGGDDRIFGYNGADTICGGDGNDVIRGGKRGDALFGDEGRDRLFGDSGSDALYGGTGNDLLIGGFGDDGLFGEGGRRDRLYGRAGLNNCVDAQSTTRRDAVCPVPPVPGTPRASGEYLVGPEVSPGTYAAERYWETQTIDDDIIDNDFVGTGCRSIAVVTAEAYSVQFSGEWIPIENAPLIKPVGTDIDCGVYRVGLEIEAGRQYRLTPSSDSSTYWAALAADLDIIENDLVNGTILFTVPLEAVFVEISRGTLTLLD